MMAPFDIRPRADIDPDQWDGLAEASDEAWLWHRADLIDAMMASPVNRLDLSFGMTDQRGALCAIVPLYLAYHRVVGVIPHYFIHGLGGPACVKGIAPELRQQLLDRIREQIVSLMAAHNAERSELRISALTPFLRGPEAPRINPLILAGFENTQGETWTIDLGQPSEAIRARYFNGTRYKLRRATKTPFNLREASGNRDLEIYYDLHRQTYTRTGAVSNPIDYFRIIFERFIPRGLCRILFFERGGEVIAAQNTAIYKGGAYYWTGASSNEKGGGDNRVLFDDQIMHAKARGCAVYEIGEAFVNTTDAKKRGLSDFKRSFGAELTPYYGGRLLASQWKFRLLRAARSLLRADDA
ncbi:MAG: GNAT family N-acetyltransferase [Candidatus Binataceae bacterium]|jgi:hypothetical protein